MTALDQSVAAMPAARRIPSRVLHWDDERVIGNSLIVTLKPGFAFDGANGPDPEHVRGFDTVREAREAVREASPCACERCLDPREGSP